MLSMKKYIHSVLKWGTLLVVGVIPVLCFKTWLFPHVTSKIFFFYGAIEILTVFWVYLVLTDTSYRFSKMQWFSLVPFSAYIGWLTIAGMASFNPHLSIWSTLMRGTGLLTLWHGLLFVVILMSLMQKYGKLFVYTLMKWSLVAGAVVGGSIWLGNEGFDMPIAVLQKGNGGGLIGNSSLAAAYLLFVLTFGIVLLFAKEVQKKWWIVTALAIILFSPIFVNILGLFTGVGIMGSARAATASIGIGVGVYVLCCGIFSSQKLYKVLGWSGLVLGVVMFSVVWNQLMTPGTRIYQMFLAETSDARFIFWDIAQKSLHNRPLVGYGPENFSIAVQQHFNPQLLSKDSGYEAWSDRAHNIYFDTGVSGGYPAVALYAILLVSMVWAVSRAYKDGILSSKEAGVYIALIVAYVIQNLTVFDGFVSLFVLYIFLAIIYGKQKSVSSAANAISTTSAAPWVSGVLAIAALYGIYTFSYLPMQKAIRFGSVMGDTIDRRPARYVTLLSGSLVGTDWDVSGLAHDEYKLYASNPVAVKSNTKLLPFAQKDVAAFIEYAEKVAQTNTTDYRLYLSLVHLYSTAIYLGDMPYNKEISDKIQSYINYGRTLTPNDPQLAWADAQLAAWKGDIPGVVVAYKKGIAIDPSLSASHRLLIQFLDAIGDKKGAQKALLDAQQVIPGFSL